MRGTMYVYVVALQKRTCKARASCWSRTRVQGVQQRTGSPDDSLTTAPVVWFTERICETHDAHNTRERPEHEEREASKVYSAPTPATTSRKRGGWKAK